MPRQHESDLSQIRHHIPQNERIVIFQIQLNARAQVRALGKHGQILELKDTLDDLCGRAQLLNLNPRLLGLGQDHRLAIHKVPYTLKDEILARARDFKFFCEGIKITTDLLKIAGRHIDNGGKLNIGHLNVIHVGVKKLHHPGICRLLLGILSPDPQLVRIGGGEKQGQRVRIGQRLDQLEQVDHVDSQDELVRAEEILKLVGIEPQIRQNHVRLVHINDLDARGIKLNVGLGQNLLQTLYQCPKGARLNCANLKEIPIRICFTGCAHLRNSGRRALGLFRFYAVEFASCAGPRTSAERNAFSGFASAA